MNKWFVLLLVISCSSCKESKHSLDTNKKPLRAFEIDSIISKMPNDSVLHDKTRLGTTMTASWEFHYDSANTLYRIVEFQDSSSFKPGMTGNINKYYFNNERLMKVTAFKEMEDTLLYLGGYYVDKDSVIYYVKKSPELLPLSLYYKRADSFFKKSPVKN